MRPFLRRIAVPLLAAALALILVPAVARADPVVFAAASLKEGLDAAAAAFARERGGPPPLLSYAASSALARQIEQGAPADLFVSADRDWMDHLERGGLLRAGTRATLASNRLVLIGPSAGPAPALRLAPGVALADALGPGGRLAQAENVRVALTLVARGEAPLGIVYATDARAEPRVRVVDTFPEASHPPIVYPAAVVASSRSARAAAFLDWLRSPAGVAVFAAHGFAPAPR
ncbi:MAG: molybdate ABC transporter substrate-binding protein [Burkholderiales bacterium]